MLEMLLLFMSICRTTRLTALKALHGIFDIDQCLHGYPRNDRGRLLSWARRGHAEENASSCPTLLASSTWSDCSTIGYALQPRSQRAFQSRQTSTVLWEEKADLPGWRPVVVL